jgi:hypothetical protein
MRRRTDQIFIATALKLDFMFKGPNTSVPGAKQTRQHITIRKVDLAALIYLRNRALFILCFFDAFLDPPLLSAGNIITPTRFVPRIFKKIFKYTKTVVKMKSVVVVISIGRIISLWVKLKP